MKLIALTQRVSIDPATHERRDCLDQRWQAVIERVGGVAAGLPNAPPARVGSLLDRLRPDAVILTGGNSIDGLDPDASDGAPERDAFEHRLIDETLGRSIPIFGVCRGMQILNVHFGGKLSRLSGHVARDHDLSIDWPGVSSTRRVNSFHNWGIAPGDLAPALAPFARDAEGNIEGFAHPRHRIAAIMWHPERETVLATDDRAILESCL